MQKWKGFSEAKNEALFSKIAVAKLCGIFYLNAHTHARTGESNPFEKWPDVKRGTESKA